MTSAIIPRAQRERAAICKLRLNILVWVPCTLAAAGLATGERMAALAMLTVVGFLVYAVLQRQVRLSLRAPDQPLPGNKGPTATPTAAVVFALFTPVTLVHFAVDKASILLVHGLQDYYWIVCEAVGIDYAWYQGAAAGQNSLSSTIPP